MNAIIKQEQPQQMAAIEQVLVGGDLAPLTAIQRVQYYNRVCESVGLNPLTRPFDYLRLNNKLVLYARRDAADQLRSIHGISLSKPTIDYVDDLIIVTIEAKDKTGRTDTDLGAVSLKGLAGEAKANAILKAITKAKRRVTLSLAGLGWLDETEVDSIPGAQRVAVDTETGEIVDGDVIFQSEPSPPATNDSRATPPHNRLWGIGMAVLGSDWDAARPWIIRQWTKNETPDNIRTSATELSDDEKTQLGDYLNTHAATIQKLWPQQKAKFEKALTGATQQPQAA